MKLITFEGFDCTGKTTYSKFLADKLRSSGFNVYFSSEPFGSKGLQSIRKELLKSDVTPLTQAVFFIASRLENVLQVLNDKQNYDFVIFDRFEDSTIAYQVFGMGCDKNIVKDIAKILKIDFEPEITFLLEFSSYEEFEKRISVRKEKSKYESMGKDFYERVMKGYRFIENEKPRRFVRINSVEKNMQECYNLIWSFFCKKFDIDLC